MTECCAVGGAPFIFSARQEPRRDTTHVLIGLLALVAVLAQTLLALVRGHLVTLLFLSVWHS